MEGPLLNAKVGGRDRKACRQTNKQTKTINCTTCHCSTVVPIHRADRQTRAANVIPIANWTKEARSHLIDCWPLQSKRELSQGCLEKKLQRLACTQAWRSQGMKQLKAAAFYAYLLETSRGHAAVEGKLDTLKEACR